jgi:hypothetical protein
MSDGRVPDWAKEKQDWIVKVYDRLSGAEVVLVEGLTFAELQLHCLANWPTEFQANRVIASSLTKQWDEESER